MATADYSEPVAKLLTYGKGKIARSPDDWPDYVTEFGLDSENIPDLIRMATDEDLSDGEEGDVALWGPVHAWRALGQLHAETAIKPLLALMDRDDDWVSEEVPDVYGLIGPAAIPALAGYLGGNHEQSPLTRAASGLKAIGRHHPEAREGAVNALLRQLEMFADNDPGLNGFLISDLLDLKAVEAAPIMEQAFAADAVDTMIMGDWEDAQYELGLRATPPERTPRPPLNIPGLTPFTLPKPSRKKAAKKTQTSMAKASRSKNRKHK